MVKNLFMQIRQNFAIFGPVHSNNYDPYYDVKSLTWFTIQTNGYRYSNNLIIYCQVANQDKLLKT